MGILIKVARVQGFRGLKNIEVELNKTTILTGMNNSGKTTFLKALQLALGNRQFISQDDFFIHENTISEKIIIDLLIIPLDNDNKQCENFSENWEILFTTERIRFNTAGQAFVPLRTIITFDAIKNNYRTEQFIQQEWPEFIKGDTNWFDIDNGKKTNFHFDEIPFHYMDAQRDILEDTKLRNSYLGRMLSKIEYSPDDIKDIEAQIKTLNERAVNSSEILTNIKKTLIELDTAMDSKSDGIEITPFTKKIRDLNKGLTIYYSDNEDSFSMEYHGMGTRSWSSLLTLKSFISLLTQYAKKEDTVFFPILAIEEPEAHLHPNAQKKLFKQIDTMTGQKIISTHSPYIAAVAEIAQIRNFYKDINVSCGKIEIENLTDEDIRKIKRQVINTKGEIFFSKVIVFFEGETEEQALPILALKYFNKTHVEMGLDFVGVCGFGNYLPFLRFAENLRIPWLIFSDAESDIKTKVQKQFADCRTSKNASDCIIFVEDGNDFERQLIADGYSDEIRQAIAYFDNYCNDHHKAAREKEIKGYNDSKLYEIITSKKTQFAPVIAEQIIESDKELSPKLIELFDKISVILKLKEEEA